MTNEGLGYIVERYTAIWIDYIQKFRGEYWFNHFGRMYKFSDKETSQQFRACYVLLKFIYENIVAEQERFSSTDDIDLKALNNTLFHHPDEIDVSKIVGVVLKAIEKRKNKEQAEYYNKKNYWSNSEKDIDKLGLWLYPLNICISYDNPRDFTAMSTEVACFDKITLNTDYEQLINLPPCDNFQTLCYNVFGVVGEEYIRLLSIISKSVQKIKGAQFFVSVKGDGGSGKSTFIAVMKEVFKNIVIEINEDVFNKKTQPYDFIADKRKMAQSSVIMIDESSDAYKDNTLIKKITSGTSMAYREIGREGGTIDICSSVFYFSNNPIVLNEIDSGTMRRMIQYQSPRDRKQIDWDGHSNFVDLFLRERDSIIRDFIVSFLRDPENVGVINEASVVVSEMQEIFDMIEYDPLSVVPVAEFNEVINKQVGKITNRQRRILNNELARLGIMIRNARVDKVVTRSYVNMSWRSENYLKDILNEF